MTIQVATEPRQDRRKADYTDRPLSAEERIFAAEPENYNKLFKYMRMYRLDQEEWYDILVIPYLNTVKKYLTMPRLQEYKFSTILFRNLDSARLNYYRSMNRKKRKPEGGITSLDLVIEDNDGKEHLIEAWLIDKKSSVEKQVMFKELFREFYEKCITYEDDFYGEGEINEYLKCELDLLLEGYSRYRTWKETEKKYPYGYHAEDLEKDIQGFRQVFKQVFGI